MKKGCGKDICTNKYCFKNPLSNNLFKQSNNNQYFTSMVLEHQNVNLQCIESADKKFSNAKEMLHSTIKLLSENN